MGKNKIAIYTAIFGDYDEIIEPEQKIEGCDFYCFTDNENLKSDLYKIIKVERQFSDPTRDARKIKILSHKFLPDYEYTLWVDGHVIFRNFDVNKMFLQFLVEHDFAVHKHRFRSCVYDEFNECVKLEVDFPHIMSNQIIKYLKEGYPINNDLVETGVIFRRHTILSEKINNCWWEEVRNNSKRDQLSFNYVFWKNKINFFRIDQSIGDGKYFCIRRHTNGNYKKRKESSQLNDLRIKVLKLEGENFKVNELNRKMTKTENLNLKSLLTDSRNKNIKNIGVNLGIKNSKVLFLEDLFFRSIKDPWKILTFPINFLIILFKK